MVDLQDGWRLIVKQITFDWIINVVKSIWGLPEPLESGNWLY